MAGLTVAETASNVVLFGGAWKDLLEKCSAYGNDPGPDTRTDLVTSAQGFVSAVTALANTPGYTALSQVTGFAAAVANINKDIASYQSAKTDDERIQDAATVLQDCTSIGGAVATFVGGVASDLGADGLVEIMESLGARFTVLGAIATLVPLGQSVGTWYNNTYLPQLKKFLGDSSTQQDEDMLLNMDSSGTTGEIIMAGQAGDTLSGSALQYTETGADPGSVAVAENGSYNKYTISGKDVLADTTQSQVSLNTAVNATIEGNNNVVAATGGISTATLSGNQNSIQVDSTGSGSSFTVKGAGTSGDSVQLTGATNVTITVADATTAINLAGGTNGSITISSSATTSTGVTVNGVSGDNTTIAGNNLLFDASGGQYNLTGTSDLVTLHSGTAVTVAGTSNDQIKDGATGQVLSFGPSTGLFASGAEQLFGSNGMDWGYAGESATFTVNADGSMIVKAIGDASDYALYDVNSSGQLTEAQGFYNGAVYTTISYIYSNGSPTESKEYDKNGTLAVVNQLDSKGNVISGQGYNSAGAMTDQYWESSTYAVQYNYPFANSYFGGASVYTLIANGTRSQIYDSSGDELDDVTTNRDGGGSDWTFASGSAYATAEQTEIAIGASGQGAISEKIAFNGSTGLVTQATLYGGFSSAGVASTEEVLTSSGGKYFSQIDTYNPATGQLTGSVTYDADTGSVTGQSGSAAAVAAVLTSTYADQAAAKFDPSAYGIPAPGAATVPEASQSVQANPVAGVTVENGAGNSRYQFSSPSPAEVQPEMVSSGLPWRPGVATDSWRGDTHGQLSDAMLASRVSGNLTSDSQVDRLIQVMATFSAGHTGLDIPPSAHPAITDPTLLTTVNSAWHH